MTRIPVPDRAAQGFVLTLAFLLLGACTSIPVEERATLRAEIDREASATISMLTNREPGFEQQLGESAGYFTARVSGATVALVGGGKGLGVLVDRRSGERTYMNLKRVDLAAGLGANVTRVLVLADGEEDLEAMRNGRYFRALTAQAAAGESGGTSNYMRGGQNVFTLSESGASLAASARLVQLTVNPDLTDTGLSEISLPNIGFDIDDGRESAEQPRWDRKLPFLAQDVIDLGYELPRPYGVKLLYTNVDQAQVLDGLKVGFSGSEKQPFEFVDFQNARSDSDSWQVIGDLWLFPFMNLFAYVGDVDGRAPMDVILDGNGILEHLEINCSLPGNLVPCNLLEGRDFTLPINASYTGINYGLGFNLAGGWKGFFFTLPVSFSWVDMDTTTVEGDAVISASPRAGRVFKLGSNGNLALYVGASYLDSDLTGTGSLPIGDTGITIDYDIDQSNRDKWAGVLGANWDLNDRWSIHLEYNGFIGSRDSLIASLGWRY